MNGLLLVYKMESKKMSNAENMLGNKHTPIDLEEAKKSNILITGTNQQGKSLLAMSISDILMRNQWQILVFDNVGHWRKKSSIPLYYKVSETTMRYVLPLHTSMIYDISLLLPSYQKEFCEMVLKDVWNSRIESEPQKWLLVLFEEFQLYAKNVRGNVSQNILRLMSVGANHKARCLGITPDMSLIDCAFIRLANQRYHFRLGNEPNAKRRFRAYYGLDWCRIAQTLDVGYTIYYNNEKLRIQKIPLFRSNVRPQHYIEHRPQPQYRGPKKRKLIDKIKIALSGQQEPEFDDIDSESEIEIDESEEYPEEW